MGPSIVIDGDGALVHELLAVHVASMGPSIVIDGDNRRDQVTATVERASMGPSIVIDGDRRRRVRIRALGIAASMGPSIVIDGDVIASIGEPTHTLLQWGRRS